MRIAKQKKSEDLNARAQNMASNRISNLYNQINVESDNSLTRAVDANKAMYKQQALANSNLGREKKFQAKNANVQGVRKSQDRRNVKQGVNRKRVQQTHQNPQVNQWIKSYDVSKYQVKQNSKANVKSQAYKTPKRNIQAKQPPVKTSRRRQVNSVKPVRRQNMVQNMYSNPAEEVRRRRKLEAKIREMSK